MIIYYKKEQALQLMRCLFLVLTYVYKIMVRLMYIADIILDF